MGTAYTAADWVPRDDMAVLADCSVDTIRRDEKKHGLETRTDDAGRVLVNVGDFLRIGRPRNPPRQTADSLGIAYRDETSGNWRSMHPDFVFFHEVDGQAKASIIDPHGHHLDDSLVKLQALARFAEEHGDSFHRIEALSKVGDVMKMLNLRDQHVRDGIKKGGQSVDWFYNSEIAVNYYAEATAGR